METTPDSPWKGTRTRPPELTITDIPPASLDPDTISPQSTARTPSKWKKVKLVAMVSVAKSPVEKYKHLQAKHALKNSMKGVTKMSSNAAYFSPTTSTAASSEKDVESGWDKSVSATKTPSMALRRLESRGVQQAQPKGIESRPSLQRRLILKQEDQFESWAEKVFNELLITGQLWFDFFTPKEMNNHNPYFTIMFLMLNLTLYAYMAGQYPYWKLRDAPYNDYELEGQADVHTDFHATYTTDPRGLSYFFGGGDESRIEYFTFNFHFLLLWGARYLPAIAEGQDYRWVTSLFIHENHHHVLSNMGLFLLICYSMETKYGSARIVPIAFIAGIGGGFFRCQVVMGASGVVFGLFGLFITDIVMNFETVKRPLFQCTAIFIFLVYFIWTMATIKSGSSHASHLGGLICGVFPSFLILPNFKKEDWEAVLPFISISVSLIVVLIFPAYLYQGVIPDLDCT